VNNSYYLVTGGSDDFINIFRIIKLDDAQKLLLNQKLLHIDLKTDELEDTNQMEDSIIPHF